MSVPDTYAALRLYRHAFVMSDQHDRISRVVQLVKQCHNLVARLRIQVPGGFIRKEHRRMSRHRPGNGHPLLLAAGQLIRAVVPPSVELHPFQRRSGPFSSLPCRHALVNHRELHILLGAQISDQVEALKDKADFPAADLRQLPLRIILNRDAVQHVLSLIRHIQAAHDIHQRRLAAPGRADDTHEFPLTDMQVGVIQRPKLLTAHPVNFRNILKNNHSRRLPAAQVRLPVFSPYPLNPPPKPKGL